MSFKSSINFSSDQVLRQGIREVGGVKACADNANAGGVFGVQNCGKIADAILKHSLTRMKLSH